MACRHRKEGKDHGTSFYRVTPWIEALLYQQRKVKFPQEFDALDLATDELRAKLLPASRRLKEIEKERGERRKVRKRTKQAAPAAPGPSSSAVAPATTDVEMADASTAPAVSTEGGAAVAATGDGKEKAVVLGEPEDEIELRKKEAAELAQLIDEDTKKDVGCSATGLYELVGEFFFSLFGLFDRWDGNLTWYLYSQLSSRTRAPLRMPDTISAS